MPAPAYLFTNDMWKLVPIFTLWTNWSTTNIVYPLERVIMPPLTNEPPELAECCGLPRTQQSGKLYTNVYLQVIYNGVQNRIYKVDTFEVTNWNVIREIGPLRREMLVEPDAQSFLWNVPIKQGIPVLVIPPIVIPPDPDPNPELIPDPDVDPLPGVPTTLDVPVPDLLRRLQKKDVP